MIKTGYLLALDASTKEIGYSIWNKETKELIELDHYTHEKHVSIIEKADNFESDFLKPLLNKYPNINEMVIEESFTKFGQFSDDKTIAILNQINALYQYVCYKADLNISTITVSDSRKYAFPGHKFVHKKNAGGMNQKEQAFVLVLARLGEERFPSKILSRGKNKGTKKFEDYAYDMSDGFVIGAAFISEEYQKKVLIK